MKRRPIWYASIHRGYARPRIYGPFQTRRAARAFCAGQGIAIRAAR